MKHYFEEIGMWPHSSRSVEFSYTLGFIFCLLLSLIGYELVVQHMGAAQVVIPLLVTLAIMQFVTQVICFLHIDLARIARVRLVALLGALFFVVILVGGSVWIMSELSGRVMPSTDEMIRYMQTQPGI